MSNNELIKRAEAFVMSHPTHEITVERGTEGIYIIQDLLTAIKGKGLDNAAAQMLQAIEEAHPEGGMPNWMIKPYWDLREAWGTK
jgi:hypothetical protein